MSSAAIQDVEIPRAAATQNICLARPLPSVGASAQDGRLGYVYLYTSGSYEALDTRVDLSAPDVQLSFEDVEGYID